MVLLLLQVIKVGLVTAYAPNMTYYCLHALNRYYSPKPKFDFSCSGGMSYACTLTLPPSAPFQTLVGPICKSTLLAKQLVCLEACKKLHQLGALDDHLLPLVEKRLGVEALEKNGPCSGAGMSVALYDILQYIAK